MFHPASKNFVLICILFVSLVLSACGGHKVLKEPQPFTVQTLLASASDERLIAQLDWVTVRDGPGTWVRNADWDQYMFKVTNASGQPMRITGAAVYDSLDTRMESETNRKLLVKSSKKVARRYKEEGLKVKAGLGAGTLIAAGTVALATGAGIVAGGGIFITGAAAGAAATGILLAPVLATGGIMRGINNGKVSRTIVERASVFPLDIAPGAMVDLVVFFPLAPSPNQVELTYMLTSGPQVINIDTRETLHGLHIGTTD